VSHISSTSTADEGRFVPGTLLGGRYRIIGLLGRGGMGEVYRATDLALGQSVALKFLPQEAAQDQRLLERFHGEVRVARQVSHPNVCRVYDIGQAEGMPFISMEYVDGEDLASLLLRIGRLPATKALETARRLCAGLAAAHDRGIMHRDLKPQNIMINKRGDVVIMDFGLAALADQLSGAEARHGTPAYMAPEQLKGAEVTAKSDIYALGLVLYELFTGHRPYDANTVKRLLHQQESAHLTSMASIAADIDPAVEKAVRRCLDPDPAKRPANALSVAAALPGGDPLAAAAAGDQQGLARRYSVPCLVVIVLCLCGSLALRDRQCAVMHTALDDSPEVLAHRAREIAASFGYAKKPADSHLEVADRNDLLEALKQLPRPHKWDEWLASEAPIMATYRESPALLDAEPYGQVTDENPPPTQPGMLRVAVDGAGRLREFLAVPEREAAEVTPAVMPESVFRAAGLDMAAFTEMPSNAVPPGAMGESRAWIGPHPKIPKTELTVEVASWKGRITRASVKWPKAAATPTSLAWKVRGLLLILMASMGVLSAVLLARRNWKLGRADRKGALRLALATFLLSMVAWVGIVHAIPSDAMIGIFFSSGADWLLFSAGVWLLYLALEPMVRARWPHAIVSWNRLLAGRWLDAQVGSHALIGATVGAAIWMAASLVDDFRTDALSGLSAISTAGLGARAWIGSHAVTAQGALVFGLLVFFAICGLRRLVKRDLMAATLASLLFTISNAENFVNSPNWQLKAAVFLGIFVALISVLLRVGMVATMFAIFFINSFNKITLGMDWKTWYAPSGLATFLLLLAIAAFAFWRSLGRQELFGGGAAEG